MHDVCDTHYVTQRKTKYTTKIYDQKNMTVWRDNSTESFTVHKDGSLPNHFFASHSLTLHNTSKLGGRDR